MKGSFRRKNQGLRRELSAVHRKTRYKLRATGKATEKKSLVSRVLGLRGEW